MFKAFKERRPWAAVIINLVFGPFLGMLYLGRGTIAFAYLLLGFILATPLIFFFPVTLSVGSMGVWLVGLPLNIVGAIHGARIAKAPAGQACFPIYAKWYSLIAINLSFLAVAFLIRTFLYQPFDAPSASMEPSVNIGDYFWVSKRAYDKTSPQRGDIIVFHWTDGDYVKRIVAVPGDRVQMVAGKLVLNGRSVLRRRVADFVTEDPYGIVRPIRQFEETLPSGRSYRTLDLSDNSNEDNTDVFTVPADSYFVLGDNRDNSNDSRMDVGFVPRGSILGKVVVKFIDRQHKTMIRESVN